MSAVGGREAPLPDPQHLTRVVALDGPAGSGKSTVARQAALALGWRFVDTGATYRAVTLHVLRAGIDLADAEAVGRVARRARVELDVDPLSPRVLLDGEDVTAEIRGAAVTSAVSAVSAVPAVRQHLVSLQRELMGVDGAVVEGRDIATVVAPLAAVKVYLDASADVRARRRAAELPGGQGAPSGTLGGAADRIAVVERALAHRDAVDDRTNALQPTEGALHLDTSDLSVQQVVEVIVALAQRAGVVSDSVPGEHAASPVAAHAETPPTSPSATSPPTTPPKREAGP